MARDFYGKKRSEVRLKKAIFKIKVLQCMIRTFVVVSFRYNNEIIIHNNYIYRCSYNLKEGSDGPPSLPWHV